MLKKITQELLSIQIEREVDSKYITQMPECIRHFQVTEKTTLEAIKMISNLLRKSLMVSIYGDVKQDVLAEINDSKSFKWVTLRGDVSADVVGSISLAKKLVIDDVTNIEAIESVKHSKVLISIDTPLDAIKSLPERVKAVEVIHAEINDINEDVIAALKEKNITISSNVKTARDRSNPNRLSCSFVGSSSLGS